MARRWSLVVTLAALLALALVVPAAATGGDGGWLRGRRIVELPVTFNVQNVNNTAVPCEAGGGTYQIQGHITGPARALARPESVTLFLHGLDYGEFFANFEAVPDYDFAQKMAEDGHITVTIDRLGYDNSLNGVNGFDICFGSHATIASQIITQLRSGEYYTGLPHSPTFPKVVLAGHSVGGMIAQIEAYTFDDIDGLMVLSYSDLNLSELAMQASTYATTTCQEQGGFPYYGDFGPDGYVFFGATPQAFIRAHFFVRNADPTVVALTAYPLRNRNPCGDVLSYQAAVQTNLANINAIDVPTLVLSGEEDAIYPQTPDDQASLLDDSVEDLSVVTIPKTGHALTLHLTRDQFQEAVSEWLDERDF